MMCLRNGDRSIINFDCVVLSLIVWWFAINLTRLFVLIFNGSLKLRFLLCTVSVNFWGTTLFHLKILLFHVSFILFLYFSLRNQVRGWVELCSPDPLKPLPAGWENTEGIASLNSNSLFWRNQLASLGSPVASTRRRPIALMVTPVDSPYIYIYIYIYIVDFDIHST